jgi:serine/threonine protein phosphatase PrpC
VVNFSDDALQKRIARFIAEVRVPRAGNSDLNAFVGTAVGSVRKLNQDRALFLWADYPEQPTKDFSLAVLCDGMGGMLSGDEAAIIAISVFVSRVLRTTRLPATERLRKAALDANDVVHRQLAGRGGTTLSAVLQTAEGTKLGVNIGDSRVYGIKRSRELIQLSRDDTLAAVLGDNQNLDANQNRLVQFVGMGEGVEPSLFDVGAIELETILITSDGVHAAPTAALSQIARVSKSEAEFGRKLLALAELLGGRDNGTVIVFRTERPSRPCNEEFGLNLKFLSAVEQLEVWIPILNDDGRQQSGPSTDKKQVAAGEEHQKVSPRSDDEAWMGRKRPRRRKQPRKSPGSSEQSLPLDDEKVAPIVDIKFPPST